MLLLLDNYDSFTYNVYQLMCELGAEVEVVRNDKITVEQVAARKYDGIVISPGPGVPSDSGITESLIGTMKGRVPILGICLGHQAIGEVFGGKLENLSDVFHGVATEGTQFSNDYIFDHLPKRITMGRYHSWVVSRDNFPSCLEITAVSDEGQIMALRHKHYDIHGIQFHPESVLTPEGKTIVRNFILK